MSRNNNFGINLESNRIRNNPDNSATRGVILCENCRTTVLGEKTALRGFVPNKANGGRCDCLDKVIDNLNYQADRGIS